MKLDQITHPPLRQSIQQLIYCCDELEDENPQEIDNIRGVIHRAIDDILNGSLSDADEKLTVVKARLNQLAGTRDTDPGVEVMPKSERRPIS